MITFDKLKIVVAEKYITNIDEDIFTTIIKNGQIVEYRYEQQYPYLLYIEKDLIEQELVIEFTSKILHEDYPLLINNDTIYKCLENINSLGICYLDIPNIISAAHVVKADVTKDICCDKYEQLIGSLKTSITNYNKYLSRVVNGTFVIEKNVISRARKLRLTIYNKDSEMQLKANQEFISKLANYKEMTEYFKGKVRFELNLNSMEQIRKQLNIKSTMLYDVLHTNINPIVNFMDKVFEDEHSTADMKLRDLERLALLEKVDMDMHKLEMIVRQHTSPKSHISQLMQPYRNILRTIEHQGINPLQTIRNLLLFEIFLTFIVSL